MKILDATCGYRAMWWDKKNPDVIYLDQRKEVKPNIQARWQFLPFINNAFDLIVFDPPHIPAKKTNKGITLKRYGRINTPTFCQDFFQAFKELNRVLKTGGFLILKWNNNSIRATKVLSMAREWKPLFGHKTGIKNFPNRKRSSITEWFTFYKK